MPSAEAVTSCRPAATGVPSASPVRAAAAAVTWPTISAEPAIGGSAADEVVEAEEPQRLGRIVLGADVGEGGAGLGAVGADVPVRQKRSQSLQAKAWRCGA